MVQAKMMGEFVPDSIVHLLLQLVHVVCDEADWILENSNFVRQVTIDVAVPLRQRNTFVQTK